MLGNLLIFSPQLEKCLTILISKMKDSARSSAFWMLLKLSSVIPSWKMESCDKGIKIEKTALPRSSLPPGSPSLQSKAFIYTVSPGGMFHANSFKSLPFTCSTQTSASFLQRCHSPLPSLCCWPLSRLVIELFLAKNKLPNL